MALQKFISTFGGHEALALCRNFTIAISKPVTSGSSITTYEAHKLLTGGLKDSWQYDYRKSDWLQLKSALLKFIRDNKSDSSYLKNQICEMLMQLAQVASYFFSTPEMDKGESVNKLFNSIVETYLNAINNNSTANYTEVLHSIQAVGEWNVESLQTIARIGVALKKFANILQGCIYANDLKDAVSHYQNYCGVTLTTDFSTAAIADATYWTKTYTQKICSINKPETSTNFPLFSTLPIPELKSARDAELINKDGILKVPVSELIRHFYKNDLFFPLTKKAFKSIDGILRTAKGETISCERLARAATDLQKTGEVDRNHRFTKDKKTSGNLK